jgi:LacI family transcriptional regulator
LILLPGDTRKFDFLIRKILRHGVAVTCVGSDVPNTDRIGSVATHAYVSGSIAAELLSLKLLRKTNVAIFSGELFNLDHAEKLRGFAATLAVQAPHLTLLPALESHENPRKAHRQALELMQRPDRPDGIYVSTANSIPVLQALDELRLLDKVQIITTDLFQQLVPFLEFGNVLATLYQRPYTQGKMAFESLLAYLRGETKQQRVVRLAPHVIFRSNLSLFTNQITKTDEELDIELLHA